MWHWHSVACTAGMPEFEARLDVEFFTQELSPHLSEEQAAQRLRLDLYDVRNDIFVALDQVQPYAKAG